MRTTLDLDEKAVQEAMAIAPGRTKTAIIEEALIEFTRRRHLAQFRDLRGKFEWEGNLDELRGRQPRPKTHKADAGTNERPHR